MEEDKIVEETKKKRRNTKKYHTVEKGENRWILMKKYDISEEKLDKLNPKFEGKWLTLKNGVIVRVK